jgi:hypothetical protein
VPQPVWQLVAASSSGVNLTLLPLASDMSVTYQLGGASVCEFSVPLTAPDAELVRRGTTRVKAYRDGALRFHGIVWTVEKEASESGVAMMKVVAVDAYGTTLARRFSTAAYASTDQGTILKQLVDDANGISTTFVRTSSALVTASIPRSVDWALTRKSIADAFSEISSALDGTDWHLRPVDDGQTIAELVVYGGRRGSTRNEVVFGYGAATVANCSAMRETGSMDDIGTWLQGDGQGGAYWQWTNAAKVAEYGRYERYSSYTDVTSSAHLSGLVYNELVRSFDPQPLVGFTAGVSAPRMFDEWDLGDTVRVHGARGALQVNTQARILGATLAVDANGVELASSIVTQPPDEMRSDSSGVERA